MLGAGIATLSYLGFDAVSTLAEDTRRPETDIGFATVTVCILQAVFCFLIVYVATLVWPAARPFENVETAILDVAHRAGGNLLFSVTTFVLLVAGVASSLTSQAGASRLLYGMGRDGLLPHRLSGYIHPRYSTPTRSIYLMGAISFFGALAIGFQLVVELVNFGAFFGFVLVNLSVIRHYYVRADSAPALIWTNLVMPMLGAVVCTLVWVNLSRNAMIAGFSWLALGVLYLAALTRGFRRPSHNWSCHEICREQDSTACVTARRDRLIEIVSDLVRRPSENQAPRGSEEACQQYVAEHLRRCGAEPLLYQPDQVPGILEHPMYWPGRQYSGRPNLGARIPGVGGGRSLILSGHIEQCPRARSPGAVIPSEGRSKEIACTGAAQTT